MESYDYIESGLIFGLNDIKTLQQFKYQAEDFKTHGDAYRFLVQYFDKYAEFPKPETLVDNYPALDASAQMLHFDYAIDTFKKQILFRRIVNTFNINKELIQEEPKRALSRIMDNLSDIEVLYDEDITHYNRNASNRFDAMKDRQKQRQMGDGLMGIPTPLSMINQTGVGWMPGELISLYARPTVGKTWMCIQAAATAVLKGYRTLLISTEMPIDAISLRMDVVMASMMGYELSHKALRNGDSCNEDDYQRFLDDINEQQLLICDHIEGSGSFTVDAIAGLVRKHSPDFVVVDGVYLVSTGMKKAMWEQSHAVFYGMKNLCLSTNTPIFVSTQATREAAANMYVPPRPDQVAFGDALIRASDVVMAMSLVEEQDDRRIIQYQKYRDGQLPVDASMMMWDVDKGHIEETEFVTGDLF